MGGEGVELEEEPNRQRRRFDNTEVKGYLAGLKRKQMLLRQDRYGGTVCVCVKLNCRIVFEYLSAFP
ncbi:MAG: hypothetical protein MJE68_04515 [Proteobacteria bacterium]|nr:hypothetical protein [Pseudomonadota bacterium]